MENKLKKLIQKEQSNLSDGDMVSFNGSNSVCVKAKTISDDVYYRSFYYVASDLEETDMEYFHMLVNSGKSLLRVTEGFTVGSNVLVSVCVEVLDIDEDAIKEYLLGSMNANSKLILKDKALNFNQVSTWGFESDGFNVNDENQTIVTIPMRSGYCDFSELYKLKSFRFSVLINKSLLSVISQVYGDMDLVVVLKKGDIDYYPVMYLFKEV